jgi:hypothetical protein
MVTASKVVHITPQTNLDVLLNEAVEEPILLERDGVVFRLVHAPEAILGTPTEDRQHLTPRREGESSVEYLDRVRAFIMRGRVFDDDSTELLRESREERTAELP